MNFGLVLQNVARHIMLSNDEASYFTGLLNYKEVRRKEFLLKEGAVARHISFIHSGVLKAYYLDVKSDENVIMLATDGWWITDMYSFASGNAAMQSINAVEDSAIFQLEKNDFNHLLTKVPAFERFFRILMQNAYIREQVRVIQNLAMPAEERYMNFLEKYPYLVKRVTQKQIASYIGVSPEFLSAMRKRMKKK